MEFVLDRIEVPTFFTPLRRAAAKSLHRGSFGRVFAESSTHRQEDWITVGFISKQTPLGQGTYLGFPKRGLRKATPKEILRAIEKDHPHGRWFRPRCREVLDASFHLAMSRVVSNWTNESGKPQGDVVDIEGTSVMRGSVLNESRADIIAFGKSAAQKHAALLQRWGHVARIQRSAIQKAFLAQ